MAKLKKLFFVTLSGISGLLLTLAGLSLIELTPTLILYVGIVLLALSAIFYILPEGKKREEVS